MPGNTATECTTPETRHRARWRYKELWGDSAFEAWSADNPLPSWTAEDREFIARLLSNAQRDRTRTS